MPPQGTTAIYSCTRVEITPVEDYFIILVVHQESFNRARCECAESCSTRSGKEQAKRSEQCLMRGTVVNYFGWLKNALSGHFYGSSGASRRLCLAGVTYWTSTGVEILMSRVLKEKSERI